MKNSDISGSVKHTKTPAYVPAYEDLYGRIISGEFNTAEQLPTEMVLAKHYGISRGSMRQALAILREDGLIYNVQGSGNYVSKNYADLTGSFNALSNPVFDCALKKIDEVNVFYNYEPMAAIVRKKLNILTNEVALKCNTVYLHDGKPIAHAFHEIPSRFLQQTDVNLDSDEDIKSLVSSRLYEMASMSSARIMPSAVKEGINKYLKVGVGTQVLFVEEILYGKMNEAFVLCKYYLLPEYYQLSVVRK